MHFSEIKCKYCGYVNTNIQRYMVVNRYKLFINFAKKIVNIMLRIYCNKYVRAYKKLYTVFYIQY